MKSVIQEGASLVKAIEEGWKKAGKPAEFSIKIFQDAEHGFLGLSTKKKAKVCIFFEDKIYEPSDRQKRDFDRSNARGKERYKSDRRRDGSRGPRNRPSHHKNFEKRDKFIKSETSKQMDIAQPKLDMIPTVSAEESKQKESINKKVINAFAAKDK